MFQSVGNGEFVGKARWIKCDGEDKKKIVITGICRCIQ